jgi:pyruvate kinase
MRRAKIVATIGPATSSVVRLEELIKSGIDVFRLNFSHSTFDEHEKLLVNIRRASRNAKQQPAILQDLPGPKVRVANIREPLYLKKDSLVTITFGKLTQYGSGFSVNYPSILKAVTVGDLILIDDGLILLKAIKKTDSAIHCRVEVGGLLKPNKGVNLPTSNWQTPTLTTADKKAIMFGIKHEIDFVALSFVSDEKSIAATKRILNKHNSQAKIIAKIERSSAIHNLEKILNSADGVMVARGDLAIEASLEKVPFLQKEIIRRGNAKNVGVIIATQMLESMTEHALPTRAEVSDIANAVLDGADALMLSAETAIGNYPSKSVRMMDRIIKEAEQHGKQPLIHDTHTHHLTSNLREVISHAAMVSSANLRNVKIVLFTISGKTARLLSKFKPSADIYAFTPSEKTMLQLNLEWGVKPLYMDYRKDPEEMISEALLRLKKLKLVKRNDLLIFIVGKFEGNYPNYSLIFKQIY